MIRLQQEDDSCVTLTARHVDTEYFKMKPEMLVGKFHVWKVVTARSGMTSMLVRAHAAISKSHPFAE
jgi:hypothetical protein